MSSAAAATALVVVAALLVPAPLAAAGDILCVRELSVCVSEQRRAHGAGTCDDPDPYYSSSREYRVRVALGPSVYELGASNSCTAYDYAGQRATVSSVAVRYAASGQDAVGPRDVRVLWVGGSTGQPCDVGASVAGSPPLDGAHSAGCLPARPPEVLPLLP